MSLNEGQMTILAVDEVIKTVTSITPMAQKVKRYTPEAKAMQRSNNEVWIPVEQEAPTQEGWDLTDKETGVLSLQVKCNMGVPDNDFFTLRADEVRDETSFRERIRAAAVKLGSNVDSKIARSAVDMGSLIVSSEDEVGSFQKGWDFIAEAEEKMFARELNRSQGLSFFFNPRDYRKSVGDLAGRDIYGRISEEAYKKGTMQRQVAGFNDVLRSPKLPVLAASKATGITVKGAQSFKPEAWKIGIDGEKENVDNRIAKVTLNGGAALKRGDKISFAGVKFLSQMAKNVLTHDATFSVVAVNGNEVTITPKPIALNNKALTQEEKAYANVNTTFADGMAINILNVADAATNVFWADESIRLVSQPIPLEHKLFSGMKSHSFEIPDVGINGVVAFQGDIGTLTGKCRIALWYSTCVVRPEAVGIGIASQVS